MIEKLKVVLLILAFVSVALAKLDAVAGTIQVAQDQADPDTRRAVDHDAERAKDDDREEILDAQTKERRDAQLKAEDGERQENATDSQRRTIERKSRIKALIEK